MQRAPWSSLKIITQYSSNSVKILSLEAYTKHRDVINKKNPSFGQRLSDENINTYQNVLKVFIWMNILLEMLQHLTEFEIIDFVIFKSSDS